MLSLLPRWNYCWKCEFDTDVKIEYYYHHDGEQLGSNKKSTYQNTEQKALYYKKRNIPIYCIWQKLHSRERQMLFSTWR